MFWIHFLSPPEPSIFNALGISTNMSFQTLKIFQTYFNWNLYLSTLTIYVMSLFSKTYGHKSEHCIISLMTIIPTVVLLLYKLIEFSTHVQRNCHPTHYRTLYNPTFYKYLIIIIIASCSTRNNIIIPKFKHNVSDVFACKLHSSEWVQYTW